MPKGSAPGEYRGGRKKGTPNQATLNVETALKEALLLIPPDVIDSMSPADFLNKAWRELAKAGLGQSALAVARDAAPYFNPKLATETHRHLTDDSQRTEADLQRELDEIDARKATADQEGIVEAPMPQGPAGVVH